jgi:hypothetical protein
MPQSGKAAAPFRAHRGVALGGVALAFALAGAGSVRPAAAHHAFAAEFNVNAPVELTGTVTNVEMINPHSWIHIAVKNDDGSTTDWMIEGGSPNSLYRRGVTKASVPIGSELRVVGYQARDGSNRAVGRTITFSDGRALFFGGSAVTLPGESTTP